MIWHDIRDPNDPRLDQLAAEYNLHPLHIEDCRNRNQNAKVESQNGYLFVVLKPLELDEKYELDIGDLDFFIGRDYLITVQETNCKSLAALLDRTHSGAESLRSDQLFYRIMDQLIDGYRPLLDLLSDQMDHLEDEALTCPEQALLEQIFDMKRTLIQMRRVLSNTRDVLSSLLRSETTLVHRDMTPFLRDVYDHVIRNLDNVELHRDLLSSTTELYLSSVANRTNQVMKALTIFGSVATPALVITGIYGMNLKHLPFAEHPHSWGIVITMIAIVSSVVLLLLRRLHWW
jgi:magnesium transporter